MLDHPLIEIDWRVDEVEITPFCFSIDWMEPFGLVTIEAMPARTPVIGWRNASLPEIIEKGRSDLIVDSVDMAVEAVDWAAMIDQSVVRRSFGCRFSAA